MSEYFLDTNAVIALLKNKPAPVRDKFRRMSRKGGTFKVSSIVLYELWYGVEKSDRQAENAERLQIFLSGSVEVCHFDDEDAIIAGALRKELESSGKPIGPYDILIAAQALRLGATLVTANAAEFARVNGLKWQDWTN